MSDLAHRLESLAAATELARGRLEEEWIEGVEAVLTRSRARITHGTDSTVVALAGATGAGKSTLFNAVAGSLISPSSVRRPTTGAVHAAVWAAEEQTTGLLDWLEASKRHFITTPSPELEGLVLLDLPDFDSTTRENRMLVDRLIELVDALVWVTDPQKYADELFHENYVRPLAGYADVMVFLLNQIDLLDATAQENCRKDLIRLLQADGVPKPEVLGVSATVGTGLDQVRNVLADVVRKREVVLARMDTDLKEVAKDVPVAGATSKRLVSKRTEAGLVAALASAAGGDHVTKAAAAGYRLDAAGATGWPVTRWLRRFRAHPLRRLHLGGEGRTSLPGARPVEEAEAKLAVRRTVDEATAEWGEPWNGLARRAVAEHSGSLTDALDQAVSRSAAGFNRPRWWAAVGGLQWIVFLAMVAGLIWLGVLFGLEYFQVPTEIITPEWEGWPYPTLLAVGGAAAGVLIALLARLVAMVGARRRARRAQKAINDQIEGVAQAYVLGPIEAELSVGHELSRLLSEVAGN